MTTQEFDAYVVEYAEQHRQSIRLSGEEPEYFAEYKIRELARMARNWKLDDPKVLDFGSGIGNSVPAFRKHFSSQLVTQADVSGESLKMARRLHGGIEPQLMIENERIPTADRSYDIVFTACVFHHIPHEEHVAWLRELRRITALGGRLVIFEHNPYNPLTRHAVANCPFDANAHLITAPVLSRRMKEAGWVTPTTEYHVFFPSALARLRSAEPALRWFPLGAQYSCAAVNPG